MMIDTNIDISSIKNSKCSLSTLRTYDCSNPIYGLIEDHPRGSILESYKKDVHVMLMSKLNSFMSSNECDEETPIKLRNLLEEIIKVQLLLNCSKDE